ncbi:MAG: Peptidyl-prolyl cis-trans isomerase PpiA precursor, partial [uncultured Cytophagales bacterium]
AEKPSLPGLAAGLDGLPRAVRVPHGDHPLPHANRGRRHPPGSVYPEGSRDGGQFYSLRGRGPVQRRPLLPRGPPRQPARQRREDRGHPGGTRRGQPGKGPAAHSPRNHRADGPPAPERDAFDGPPGARQRKFRILHLHQRPAGPRLRRQPQPRRAGLRRLWAGHPGHGGGPHHPGGPGRRANPPAAGKHHLHHQNPI